MARKTRLGLDGYGVRRAGSFANKAAASISASLSAVEAADAAAFTGIAVLGSVYLDPALLGPNIVLSNMNLTATQSAAATGNTRAIAHHTSGKYYHEFTVNLTGSMQVGLCNPGLPLTEYLGQSSVFSIGVADTGGWLGAGSSGTTTAPALINGHVYGMAVDIDAGKAWCKDITAGGYWNANVSADPVTGVNGALFFVPALTEKLDGTAAPVNDGTGQAIVVRIA
jgi:hypothetical protein